MKGKDIIKFIQDHHMEDKNIHALIHGDGFVFSADITKIELSCPEDDCIFIEVDIPYCGSKCKRKSVTKYNITKKSKD